MGSGTTGAAIMAETFKEEQRAALPFKVYGFDFALLGPRNYEGDRSSFVAVQLLDFSGFFCRLY